MDSARIRMGISVGGIITAFGIAVSTCLLQVFLILSTSREQPYLIPTSNINNGADLVAIHRLINDLPLLAGSGGE